MLYFKSRDGKVPIKHETTFVNSDGITIELSVDQAYNANSLNAQSGTALAGAITQANQRILNQLGGLFYYKGSVATLSELQAKTNNQKGDVWDVKESGTNYVWDGSKWDKLSQNWDHLAHHTDYETLKSNFENHQANRDQGIVHLNAAEYTKFRQIQIFDSSEITNMINTTINEYITSNKLVTTNSLNQMVDQVIQRIEENIIQSITGQVSSNVLRKSVLDAYREEVKQKLVGHLKSTEVDEIKVYKIGQTIPPRADKVLYLVEEYGIPTNIEGGKMILTVNTTSSNRTVNFGPILGKWDVTGRSSIPQAGLLDWGDNSAIVTLGDNMGETNNLLSHTYATAGSYRITISGKVKWNGTVVKQNGATTVSNTTLCSLLTGIEIPSGQVSPIYDFADYAFANVTNLTSVPAGLFTNATDVTSVNCCFQGCTKLATIPDTIFSTLTNVISCNYVFRQTAISTIGVNVFKAFTKCNSFGACFANCPNFATIQENLFSTCTAAVTFNNCFEACTKITTIPTNLFLHNTQAKSFNSTFHNCSGIKTIPATLFSKALNNNTTSFNQCFYNCTAVTSDLPTLWNTFTQVTATNKTNCFTGCTSAPNYMVAQYKGYATGTPEAMELIITTSSANQQVGLGYHLGPATTDTAVTGGYIIWGDNTAETKFGRGEGISATKFNHNYSVTGNHTITIIGKIFWGCNTRDNTSLTTSNIPTNDITKVLKTISIPSGHTSPIYDLGTFAFAYSQQLTSIPGGLFDHCTKVQNFRNLFWYCQQLASIPAHLFDQCTAATNFSWAFDHCEVVASIPANLFDKNTLVTTFHSVFAICKKITSVPSKLFDYNTKVTTFAYAFNGCSLLKTLPTGLFAKNTLVTLFSYCFNNCPLLTPLPTDLFTANTRATSFNYCFYGCKALTTIPANLFSTCTAATDFSYCFYNCSGLTTIPSNIFNNNKSISKLDYAFMNCTNVGGNLPTLWTSHSGATHASCFCNDKKATNYDDAIIAKWTCPDDVAQGEMVLNITTDGANQEINLGPLCGGASTVISGITGGTIKWGDGSADLTFASGDGTTNTKFKHTYVTQGSYSITIKGKIRSSARPFGGSLLWRFLRSVTIPTGHPSPIYDIDQGSTSTSEIALFGSCSNLTSIPEGLFDNLRHIEKFNYMFDGCTSLKSIPANLFAKCTSAKYFYGCFNRCTALTQVSGNLFSNCTQADLFQSCFEHSGLTSIPGNLFAKCTIARNFSSTFRYTPITSIPNTIFQYNFNIVQFSSCFADTNITTIPADLFSINASFINMSSFASMFYNCRQLTEIPSTLFDTCTHATSFANCFAYCTKLTTIPENLFAKCPLATGFSSCFSYCEKLTNIPTNLFVKNTEATSFSSCFQGCTLITAIPTNLFAMCINALYFDKCFMGCSGLKAIPSTLFSKNTKVTNFDRCFYHTYISSGNSLPTLWTSHPNATHEHCFTGNSNASNFSTAVAQGWASSDPNA